MCMVRVSHHTPLRDGSNFDQQNIDFCKHVIIITLETYSFNNFKEKNHTVTCEVREKTNKMQQLDVYYQSKSNLHNARTLQHSAPQPLPTTSSRTSAAHYVQ